MDDQKEVNVVINVNGYALDPSRSYIIEVKQEDIDEHTAKGLVKALQQLSIKHVVVTSKSGESLNVVEVPDLAKELA